MVMGASFHTNHVIEGRHMPLSGRERALRKLQNEAPAMVEVLSGSGLTISNFVMNGEVPDLPVLEFHCSRCGGHVIVHCVQVEGQITCPCGPLVGKPL